MIQSFLRLKLFKSPTTFSCVNPNRLCNTSKSSYQQPTGYFDISDELVDNLTNQKKKLKVESANKDKEVKTRHCFASRTKLIEKFKECFECSDEQAETLTENNKQLMLVTLSKVTENIEILFKNKVTVRTILDNSWLLSLPKEYILRKIPLVMRLQPRDINDMIHMIRLSTYHLLKYQKIFAAEKDVVPEGNRIYYFSKELKVEPALVSSYFARNMDIYDFAFNMIEENLKILIEYKVDPVAILSNYATFKKDPEKIRSRFDRCLKARKVKLKPWLVHCSEKAFERSLKSSEDEKSLLGDGTILDYLSDRLGYDKETMYSIVSKHESILKGRVRRVKEMLDYLLIEEKYEPYLIVNAIFILNHSLETTRSRINELKSHGCRPTGLQVVCRSQTTYRKFLSSWIEQNNKS